MSGPISPADVPSDIGQAQSAEGTMEITKSREAQVGSFKVRRAFPRRGRRTVGAWCFADHMGPADVTEDRGIDVGPHPHMGLQTVTWLLAGEVLHRDSLGSEQVTRAGQLSVMTAGFGIAHSEEATGHYRGKVHGIQLWVAQPEDTRRGEPAFEHHDRLPDVGLDHGRAIVFVGSFGGVTSPARADTDHVAMELTLRPGTSAIELRSEYEYALIVADGALGVDNQRLEPGHLGYLGRGRTSMALAASHPTRALLIGGVPFPEPIIMWWNYVARSPEEITVAHDQWLKDTGRFGTVPSPLPRIEVGPPPWALARRRT